MEPVVLCDPNEAPNPKWILGVAVGLVGSVCNSMGFVMQKWAHQYHETAPKDKQWPTLGAFIFSPMWVGGFMLTVVLSLPLDVLGLMFMPQSINACMGAVTIVLSQVIAPYLLKEPVTCMNWVATLVIVTGVLLIITFGSHCSLDYTVEEMVSLWGNPVFIVVESSAPVAMSLCLAYICLVAPARLGKKQQDKQSLKCKEVEVEYAPLQRKNTNVAVSYSLLAGIVGGQQNVFFKAASELLEQGIIQQNWSCMADWKSYIFIFMAVATAFFQLQFINLGISYWHVSKTYPVYGTSLIVFSTLYGGAYYQEYKQLTWVGVGVFPVGVVVILVGVLLLTQYKEAKDAESVGTAEAEGESVDPESPKACKADKGEADIEAEACAEADVKGDSDPSCATCYGNAMEGRPKFSE